MKISILSSLLRAFTFALGAVAPILVYGALAPRATDAAPPAQSPIVVNAVDNDPNNKLWNCETNRVPFGNNETDRSRCFSFRYQVPPGGIKNATVSISLSTLGADQDTDATIIAVGKPYAPCEWGQGKMPGCVGLHGGFQGTHKSLNLNLLDIACDRSIQGSPEAQRLVLEQLQTGTLHMLLQDDTAVYSAQLVLNGGAPSFQCGASTGAAPNLTQPPARATPPAVGNIIPQQLLLELNKWLTGTSTPQSPDQTGAVIATTIGAGLLALLALSNYLRSDASSAQRFSRARAAESTPDTRSSASVLQTDASGGASAARPSVFPEQTSSGAASASAGGIIQASPTSGGLLDALGEKAIESLPDARDTVADKLVELIGDADKTRRVEEEKKRLRKIVVEKTRAYQDAGNALKQVIDNGGDFAAAQRGWQHAGAELHTAQTNLAQLLKEFPDKQA